MKNATANDNSGKPDASKVARPVWGWGRAVTSSLHHINLTRLYTGIGNKQGYQGMLSVGRVQTTMLGLVVRRDRENEQHKKMYYYTISATFDFQGTQFSASYNIAEDDDVDCNGRIIDENYAATLAESIRGKEAIIENVTTLEKQTQPPLLFNLLRLQADASTNFDMSPEDVKNVTQSLREKHRAITYNRSDCEYLSDEHHTEAPDVLKAIAASSPGLAPLVEAADPTIKSRAFNSSKLSAHHGIIPTIAHVEHANFTPREKQLYELIARTYIAQFLPNYSYETTSLTVRVGNKTFSTTATNPITQGWKTAFNDTKPSTENTNRDSLKQLSNEQAGLCTASKADKNETKPRPKYTMATFLTGLTRVASEVKDERLKKVLIEKDAGKAGEHGGIGTPATRDTIIKILFDRGFLVTEGKGKDKRLVSTDLGKKFYDALPDNAKYPDMTAIWHEHQVMIEKGEKTLDEFFDEVVEYVSQEVERVKRDGLPIEIDFIPCPTCGYPLIPRKGKHGQFWGCQNYPECKTRFQDDNGKPKTDPEPTIPCPICKKPMRLLKKDKNEFFACTGYPECRQKTIPAQNGKPLPEKPKPTVSEVYKCTKCGKGLIRRENKAKKRFWWGCEGFPTCKATYQDVDGKPDYEEGRSKTS